MLKALLKIALLAICLLPTLSACSGDEPKTPEDNLPAETKKFVGIWYGTSGDNLELFANGKCRNWNINVEGRKDGEWAYDRNTKFLSTTTGIQTTVTLSTDNAWTGYSPSGKEYNFKKQNVTNYVFAKYKYKIEEALEKIFVKDVATKADLTEDELIVKLARKYCGCDDNGIDHEIDKFESEDGKTLSWISTIQQGNTNPLYTVSIKNDHTFIFASSYTNDYEYTEWDKATNNPVRRWHNTYTYEFDFAKGKLLEFSQTTGGYKVKFSCISLNDNDGYDYRFDGETHNNITFKSKEQTLELTIDPFK